MGSLHEEYAVIPLVTELLRDWVRGHKVVQPLCWPTIPFHHRDMIYNYNGPRFNTFPPVQLAPIARGFKWIAELVEHHTGNNVSVGSINNIIIPIS